MSSKSGNLIDVGRVSGVFGVKGWLKVKSDTDPKENILSYSPWWLKTKHGVKPFKVCDYSVKGDVILVHFDGVNDRDLAAQYSLVNIAVERAQMPELSNGDYYWHQLAGLQVVSIFDGKEVILGDVRELIETGANDVLVVIPSQDSVDNRERLVPYVPDVYVDSVDLECNMIRVSWDPDF